MFCSECIDGFVQANKTCPNFCTGNDITNMSARALINIYNDLDIKCTKCQKTFKMADLQKHEDLCGKAKCQYS